MKRYTPLLATAWLLVASAPPQIYAADNTWNNGSGNSFWDAASANWSLPTIWADNNNAFFSILGANPSGLGTSVTLNSPVTANNITINGTNYVMVGNGLNLTMGGTNPVITSMGSSNAFAVSLTGVSGLTFQGPGTNVLMGDLSLAPNPGNTYLGGTYVKSGTLILKVGAMGTGPTGLSSSSYAVDSIEGIDAGAIVREGNFDDGLDTTTSDQKVPNGQIPVSGTGSGLVVPHRLNLTGGTYDTYGNDNNQQQPQPSGWGTIINTTPYARGILKYTGFGQTNEFSGQIMDGGPLIARANNGPGYQMNVDSQAGSSSSVMIFSGSNSFSGFIRIGNGATIQLKGAGTLGYPSPILCPSRQVIQNNGTMDLNGTSQKTGYYYAGGGSIINSAIGTMSTLTVCYNCTNLTTYTNGGVAKGIMTSIQDDPVNTGLIGLTKEGVAVQPISGPANTYHGDTVVNNGVLWVQVAGAISPYSAYYLNTNHGTLLLDYAGTANVRQLWINGIPQPNGTYSAASTTAITGTGSITVTGYDFDRWSNGSGNFSWDGTSANWTSPTIWLDGNSARFDGLGADHSGAGTTVLLNSPVTVNDIAILGTNYVINGAGSALTLGGPTSTLTSSGSSNVVAASLYGTAGLTFKGNGTTVLTDDGVDGSHYTGGTIIHSGTVILQSTKGGTGGASPYALDSILGLDAGATLVLPGIWNGSKYVANPDQMGVHGQLPSYSRLNMTGGTVDLSNDPKSQHIPAPDGYGTILNSGSWTQAGLQLVTDGQDHYFYGVITDGNNGVLNGDNTSADNAGQGPGYQIGIVQQAGGVSVAGVNGGAAGPYQTWYWYGSNTYSGSTRLDGGVYLKLMGQGTIGFPSSNALTGPMRLYNAVLDLNGHNQTIALMTGGSSSAIIQNSATGTVATLTFGYGNEQNFGRNAPYTFQDSWGGGGVLALKKIITAPFPFPNVNPTTMATNCYQTLSGLCTYSGDTTVAGGKLILNAASAVSPNSAYRLSTNNYALLQLNYSGTAPARQLWINGVQQPNGVYGAGTPGIDPTSTGTITVTGADPTLTVSRAGNTLTLSWVGGGHKLQYAKNSLTGVWVDYPGGNISPVHVTIGSGAQYFRLSE